MSILGGIMCRTEGEHISNRLCSDLTRSLSRHVGDEVEVFRDSHVLLAKIDIGAYGYPAFRRDPSGSVSILAGEPLLVLDPADAPHNREDDLALLHAGWDRGDWSLLSHTAGTFCAAHYQPASHSLTLIADKLGVRPLYYWVGERYVVFATALRVLEQLAEVPKRVDLRAVTEMVSLGIPLGGRTPYKDISLLRAAEVVHIDQNSASHSQYWRWDAIAPSQEPESVLLQAAYDRFGEAIARRVQDDTAVAAYLSGGLDSRVIVGGLRARNIEVRTINFAMAGTQDQLFARRFAEAIGTRHQEVELPAGIEDTRRKVRIAPLWTAGHVPGTSMIERPRLIWSGDGGSVGLGHVYMSPTLIDLLRAGKREEAIEHFLTERDARVPYRLLRAAVVEQLTTVPALGIRDELQDIRCDDSGRGFYLFLMLNDQRRHLATHFEDLDVHRLEYHLPFFDARFLEAVISIPIDWCLEHRFYTRWLQYFPAAVTAVPWQTYPGHEPCPIPVPEPPRSQWDRAQVGAVMAGRKRTLLRQADEMLKADHFPRHVLRRRYLRFTTLLYRAGIRDYSYLIAHANQYCTYWRRSMHGAASEHRQETAPRMVEA